MTETTFEMARRCSKCGQPGELVGKRPVPRRVGIQAGAQLYQFVCMNERCRWFNTICRIVQVNPDGSIPEPVTRRAKEFPAVPDLSKEVNERLARQLELETQGGGEIPRPR